MSKQSERLYLLDAMALIHRSYYAIPHLSHRGQAVNAVYGFASTLLHILNTEEPEHILVAFDEKGPTFRDEDFADYKAHRPATPDELKSQFPLVRKLVKEFGIPSFGVEGYEADDVIGTLAKQAQDQNVEAYIVTGDHDAYQLVNHKVKVYNVSRGIQRAEIIDEDAVKEKYDFGPERMIDYKGLRGDSSDNIPGVPGVGEKTAKKLIKEFGNIEQLYEFLGCDKSAGISSEIKERSGKTSEVEEARLKEKGVSAKLRQKLCDHAETAFLSKKLATIVTNVPIQLNLEATVVKQYNEEGARELFKEWGFKSLAGKLPKAEKKELPDNQQAMF